MTEFTENQLKFLLDHLQENKDLVMKAIEDDVRIMAWSAWAIGELFPEKSPKEMFEYMRDPDLIDLKHRIRIAETDLKDFSNRGYILDTLVSIYENEQPQSFLNIENQVSYSEEEIGARSLTYLCSMRFKLGNYLKTEKFSDILSMISIWIFPIYKSRDNYIEYHNYVDSFSIDNAESPIYTNSTDIKEIDKLTAYFFFLGDPDDVYINPKELPEDTVKLRILLYLYDILFNFNLSTEQKHNLLKPFYLTGIETNEVLAKMDNMIENYQKLTKDILGINIDEVNELRKENKFYKAKIDSMEAEQEENKKQYNILFDNLLSEGYTPEQINNLFGKKN